MKIFGKTLAVSTWRDVLENTVNEVIEIDPDAYSALCRNCRATSEAIERGSASPGKSANGGFVNVNLSAEGIDGSVGEYSMLRKSQT